MKKTIGMMAGILLPALYCFLAAQQQWDAKKNPVVASINKQYESKMIPPAPALTEAELYPEAGSYRVTGTEELTVISVTMDEENKGIIWVSGLSGGNFKALLRKTPAVYKIPAQQSTDGKPVPEGTLVVDTETGSLKICLGKPFQDADPLAAFTPAEELPSSSAADSKKGKKVKKPVFHLYNAVKLHNPGTTE